MDIVTVAMLVSRYAFQIIFSIYFKFEFKMDNLFPLSSLVTMFAEIL